MMRLTEDQYEVIRPLLPVQRGNVRIANLDVINAVLYVAENAANGALCRSGSATGTRSTRACGGGRRRAFSTDCSKPCKNIA